VSWSTAAAVACGDVVAQVTLPAELTHEYHAPPDTSCAFTVPVVGAIVNATWSTFCGFAAFSVYETFDTVYPLIAPEPEPALVPGTVFDAVKAYAAGATTAATAAARR
jgi:hypothetical protein